MVASFLSSCQPVGHDDCALFLQLSVSIQGTASWRSRSAPGSLDEPATVNLPAPVSTANMKLAPAHLPGSDHFSNMTFACLQETQNPQHHPLLHLLTRQAYVQYRHQSSLKNTDQDVLFAAQRLSQFLHLLPRTPTSDYSLGLLIFIQTTCQ